MKTPFAIAVLIAAALSACRTAEAPIAVNNGPAAAANINSVRVSAEGKNASEVDLAASADGRILAVWTERDDQRNYDVFVQAFSSSLQPETPSVRVNPNPGEARSWYGDAPSILSAPDGKVYVGWNRIYADGSRGNDLMVSISGDGGKTFAEPVKVNDDSEPASHGMHGMTLDADGRVLISWLDERYLKKSAARSVSYRGPLLAMFFDHTPAATQSEAEEPDAELYFAVLSDGQLTGPNRRIAAEICPCCRVSVITAPNRTVHVAYRKVFPGQFRHIAVSTSRDGGDTFSAPVQVSDDQWKLFACPVTGAAMRMNGGDLEVAWYSGGDRSDKGIYRAISRNQASTFSPPELVSKTMLKGSPVFAANHLIFADAANILTSSGQGAQTIAPGTTPSAITVGDKPIIAFALSQNDRSIIYLAAASNSVARTQ